MRNSSSLDWLRFMHTPNDYRVSLPDPYLTYRHKKRLSIPDSQSFVNLKSNTMKNTLQRYGLLINLQIIQLKKYVL